MIKIGPVRASFAAVESLGLVALIIGAIMSNLAVSKMAKIVKVHWAVAVGSRASTTDRLRQREAIREHQLVCVRRQLTTADRGDSVIAAPN